jgi:hypothetical protein
MKRVGEALVDTQSGVARFRKSDSVDGFALGRVSRRNTF